LTESVVVELRDVTKQFGSFTAIKDLSLAINQGEFFSLLGPSGCGKTTNLRMIAGFELPTQGEVFLNGEPVGQLPPFKRNVNTVFQSYALFPHLTIEENVAFGLEMKKVPKAEIDKRVKESLELVRLPDIGRRKPHQLSGGQRQRVALARALVNRPQVLLLDEPLGALDFKLRKAMQLELKELQRQLGITFIFVTHDQEEALVMSDRIGVMQSGNLLQVGSPQEIYEQPNSRFVASFIGDTNFIPCEVISHGDGSATVSIGNAMVLTASCDVDISDGEKATLTLRPEKVHVHTNGHNPDDDTLFQAEIIEVVFMGTDTLLTVKLHDGPSLEVLHQNMQTTAQSFHAGDTISVSWQQDSARVLAS